MKTLRPGNGRLRLLFLSPAAVALLAAATPAFAQSAGGTGGAGGAGVSGGNGGIYAQDGQAGTQSPDSGTAAGGGGGGGTAHVGGAGGNDSSGQGGGTAGAAGLDGGHATTANAGGGGGGGGSLGFGISGSGTISGVDAVGGYGGVGGDNILGAGAGGGGGSGGSGISTDNVTVTVTINGSGPNIMLGGRGGDGGNSGGNAGNGGDGGAGFTIQGNNSVIILGDGTNFFNVMGGTGGSGGFGGSLNGVSGQGGAGIEAIGTGVTIILNANVLVAGGLSVGRADAITFTGGASTLTLNGGTMTGNIGDNGGGSINFNQSTAQTLSNVITGNGSVIAGGADVLTLSGNNTFSGGTTIRGTLQLGIDQTLNTPGQPSSGISASTIGTGTLTFDGGTLQAFAGSSERSIANAVQITANGGTVDAQGGFFRFTGNITDAAGSSGGTFVLESTTNGNERQVILAGNNTYSGITSVVSGIVIANSSTALSPNSAFQVGSAGTVTLSGYSNTILSLADGVGGGGVVQNAGASGVATLTLSGANGGTTTFSGVLQDGVGGDATVKLALVKNGSSTQILAGANTYTGTTAVNGGTLEIANGGSIANSASLTNAANFVVDSGGSATFGSVTNTTTGKITVAAGGSVHDDLNNAGTVINSGSYVANVASNTGTITNNGSWTGSINNTGGTFLGTGSLTGNLTIGSGAVFSPGNGTPGASMTINGSLAFSSGAFYQVAINPTTASFVNATGTATLGGASVQAFFSAGTYVAKQYTIVTAGSIGGTFNSLANTNLPSGFSTRLSYDATHAYLNLALGFGPTTPTGLNINQSNVGNALVNSFNTVGTIPIVFGALTAVSLTQASGELATASEQTTFKAMDLFLGLLTDPFMGRGGGINGASTPAGYAEDSDEASAYAARKKTDAFAMFTKAPPATFQQRWSVWAAGYGGSQSTSGNAVLGSNDTVSRIGGTAVGADYLFSPDTLAGFALAGGGTSFSVNNLGSGRSDLFQAGAYVRHTEGNAYITAALAYGWQDITTDRTVTIAGLDHLRAEFNANTYSGRIESGYRYVVPTFGGVGITPYAAGQFVTFDLPSYSESVVSGAALFALNYAGKSVSDSRSELGIRADKSYALSNGVLTLRGRLAWAHDYDPDRSIAATFQALPASGFVVNGAAQASDSALTTAAVEMKWLNGWSAAATFEGEFSKVTESYAGKGVVRYTW